MQKLLISLPDFQLPVQAAAWVVLGIFSVIRFQADYCLVVGVCLTLSIANIVGFTKCRKGARSLITLTNFHLCTLPYMVKN